MKLLLTTNGLSNSTLEQIFLEMVGSRPNLKVAMIPTAGDPIEWVPDSADSKKFIAKLTGELNVKSGKEYLWYKEKGFDVVIADLKQDPKNLREKLETADIIDVGGGDVNYLLDWAKQAKLDTYLKNILDRDVLYVGASAGSMLLNPDIGFTWWEPNDEADHVGLGIVDFMFQPIHGESDESTTQMKLVERKKHLQSLVKYPWKIYLVKDGQAIRVLGEEIEHIGPGVKEVI